MKAIFFPLLASATLLTACATSDKNAEPEPRGIAAFDGDPRLGEQVEKICFSKNITGFYNNDRDTVVLSSGVNDDYLVTVSGACPSLRRAQSVGLDSFGSCIRRNDVIIVSESAFTLNDRTGIGPDRCFVEEIYRWDNDAIVPDMPEG